MKDAILAVIALGAMGGAVLGVRAAGATWLMAAAAGPIAAVLGAGCYLWWSSSDRRETYGSLGRSLMVGALVAIVVGWVQFAIDQRIRDIDQNRDDRFRQSERAREKAAQKQSLQMALSQQGDLRGIDLRGRDLSNFYLLKKKMQDAALFGADLRSTSIARSRLDRADFECARFGDTHLEHSSLRNAHLEHADLGITHLEGADLSGAHLQSADLSEAHLTGRQGAPIDAVLTGALYDKKTKWPRAIDPVRAGAQRRGLEPAVKC